MTILSYNAILYPQRNNILIEGMKEYYISLYK